MSTPDTPNDPLFGTTPQHVIDGLADGSYAREVLSHSDEDPNRLTLSLEVPEDLEIPEPPEQPEVPETPAVPVVPAQRSSPEPV